MSVREEIDLLEGEQLPDIRETLKGVLRPGGYDPGDTVRARVKDIDGIERDAEFEILRFCGGGFAGQVYRARLVSCDEGGMVTGQDYALKFFTPRSKFRGRFRDVLYFLGFQSPFPHQYNESAVRTGLYITKLLRYVSQVEFGGVGPINDCHATFWDEHVGAYAEVNEWVEGRVTDPDVDSGILTRFLRRRREKNSKAGSHNPEPDFVSEISRKKAFMARIVKVCGELGIEDLARQVYWWTGMSQANVLTRNSGTPDCEFVWVDRRPGLPGFLLSLGDFPLLLNALLRGSIPPFDKINFKKLRSWSKAPDPQAWQSIVEELETVDSSYRRAQVDIINHHVHLLTNKKLRMGIFGYIADYWRRGGRIDDGVAESLRNGGLRMLPHLMLSCMPLFGARFQKFVGNAQYRSHVWRMLVDSKYRWDYFDQHRKVDLAMWMRDGRVSDSRAGRCLTSLPAYFRDRLCSFWVIGVPFLVALPKLLSMFSWPPWAFVVLYLAIAGTVTLPPPWQLFFTDWRYAVRSLWKAMSIGVRYIFDLPYRRDVNLQWISEQAREDVRHGYVSEEEAKQYILVAGSNAMQQYITGIMVTIALLPASEITFVLLATAGLYWVKDFDTLKAVLLGLGWWAVPLASVVVAVSPGGIFRFLYCLCQWIRHRRVPYGAAMSLAMLRVVGYLSFPVQIARTYPQFSTYLLTWSVGYLVSAVPVFGERGGLLNIWAATVFLSWPASFRTWRRERRGDQSSLV